MYLNAEMKVICLHDTFVYCACISFVFVAFDFGLDYSWMATMLGKSWPFCYSCVLSDHLVSLLGP